MPMKSGLARKISIRRYRQLAEAAHDVEELVDVALSREEGRAARHLREHAADGPNVNRLAVLRVAGEQLRQRTSASRRSQCSARSARVRANPKSHSLRMPLREISRFSGLMSRMML